MSCIPKGWGSAHACAPGSLHDTKSILGPAGDDDHDVLFFFFFNLERGKEAFPKLREILRRTRLCCQWLVNHAASQGEGLA